jgi:hypothetical protein
MVTTMATITSFMKAAVKAAAGRRVEEGLTRQWQRWLKDWQN